MKPLFALSLLATAIAASQAVAADSETSITFNGVMDVYVGQDLDNDTTIVSIFDDSDDDDTDEDDETSGSGLEMNVTVINGPLSGVVTLAVEDNGDGVDENGDADSEVEITIDDVVVTQDQFVFGQVGELMLTDEYAGDMEDDQTIDGVFDILAGIKLTIVDGLYVQFQGTQVDDDGDEDTKTYYDYGFAAQYLGENDRWSYILEAEVLNTDDQSYSYYDDNGDLQTGTVEDVEPYTYAGIGVSYSGEWFTLSSAVNNFGYDSKDSEYALESGFNFGKSQFSLTWTDYSINSSNDELLENYAQYNISDVFAMGVGYDWTVQSDAGDAIYGALIYQEGAITASAEVGLANYDADEQDFYIDSEIAYGFESEVELYGKYDYYDDAEVSDDDESENLIAIGLRYSF